MQMEKKTKNKWSLFILKALLHSEIVLNNFPKKNNEVEIINKKQKKQ